MHTSIVGLVVAIATAVIMVAMCVSVKSAAVPVPVPTALEKAARAFTKCGKDLLVVRSALTCSERCAYTHTCLQPPARIDMCTHQHMSVKCSSVNACTQDMIK